MTQKYLCQALSSTSTSPALFKLPPAKGNPPQFFFLGNFS
uniref:Uncharacterized protein n=1 Tax=Phlebotomus papatasi TaxID=29031 RepID=A0A1B0DKX2_PHLPP